FTHVIVAQAAERTRMLLAIQSYPHDLSDRIDRDGASSAPVYMRRAEEFIRENLSQPISVEALAAHAGTSVRSLYYGFSRAYGVTPMRFLRRVRLEAARTALRGRREEATTVTEIAFACGYGSLSSFCRDYKNCFGEAPSQTARRC
ncbi:MAG: AraC family transcriptional regulator, partial [Bauldia litoralis]